MRDEKKCHALRFVDVILFSTWQKTLTWCKSVHKWPILDNLIRLIWNRYVWPYNEDDILAIRTADKNFTYYIMKWTTCVVQLRTSHVDKWWGSEFSPGDQVLNGYYYEQHGNDFLHQRLVKKFQSNSAGQNCNLLL